VRRSSDAWGFTLIEVAISLGILGISLAVLMDGAYLATSVRSDVRQLTRATLLARAVIPEIEHKLARDGFGAFDRSEACDFRIEGLKDFSCEYTVKKVELPMGDLLQRLFATGTHLAGAAVAAVTGAAGGSGSTKDLVSAGSAGSALTAAAGSPGGLAAVAGALGGNPGLAANALQLYAAQMQSLLEDALREVRLTLSWPVGKKTWESVTVVTHLVEIARAGISGADQAAGQMAQQAGLSSPTPGQAATLQGAPGAVPTMPMPFPGAPPGFSPIPPTVTPYVGRPTK
jgi:Tfp pilus assembly major pilin PilA